MILALQPPNGEDDPWEVLVDPHDSFVGVLEIAPGTPARPGEVVPAEVRVGRAGPVEIYRLTAAASRSGVPWVGDRAPLVRGEPPAPFRLRAPRAGAGGIAVDVERDAPGGRAARVEGP